MPEWIRWPPVTFAHFMNCDQVDRTSLYWIRSLLHLWVKKISQCVCDGIFFFQMDLKMWWLRARTCRRSSCYRWLGSLAKSGNRWPFIWDWSLRTWMTFRRRRRTWPCRSWRCWWSGRADRCQEEPRRSTCGKVWRTWMSCRTKSNILYKWKEHICSLDQDYIQHINHRQ